MRKYVLVEVRDRDGIQQMAMKYNEKEIEFLDNINHKKRAQMALYSKQNNSYKPSDDVEIFFNYVENEN